MLLNHSQLKRVTKPYYHLDKQNAFKAIEKQLQLQKDRNSESGFGA